jgi:hypothetical protein
MKTSETMAKLAPALASALAEIHNASKDSKNPHFKSSYASLASVIDATKATLAVHGLVVVQAPGWNDGRVTVTTRIVHASGEWIEATAEAPIAKADPQGVGSAVTYLRRYSLAALCGITQEDDDGETASRRPAKPAPKRISSADWTQLASDVASLGDRINDKARAEMKAVISERDEDRYGALRDFVTDALAR